MANENNWGGWRAAANKEIDKNVYTLGSQPRQWQSLTA